MEIREALPTDLPEIISVLKASLGEEDLPLSEGIWNYKHNSNPFGQSLVLIAEEKGKIAGVRAFMKWNWQTQYKVFQAFRAVDTATHPEFQGMGIFKKLTLHAINMGVQGENHFVFNTPNEQSKPGYLKMGWQQVGKIEVAIKLSINSFWKMNRPITGYSKHKLASEKQIEDLCMVWNKRRIAGEKLFTPKSSAYLVWRYEQNPLQQYEVHCTADFYIAAYIKKRKKFNELRIAECIFINETNLRQINKIINGWSKKFGAQFISWSPKVLDLSLLSFRGAIGPVLTIRDLKIQPQEFNLLKDDDHWNYCIGDLELF